MLFDDAAVAVEIPLQAVVFRRQVAVGRELRVNALAHVAVEHHHFGHQPARLRQVVGVAVADVLEVESRPIGLSATLSWLSIVERTWSAKPSPSMSRKATSGRPKLASRWRPGLKTILMSK